MDGITDSTDMRMSKLREIVKDREAWRAAVQGVAKSRTRLSDGTKMLTLHQWNRFSLSFIIDKSVHSVVVLKLMVFFNTEDLYQWIVLQALVKCIQQVL